MHVEHLQDTNIKVVIHYTMGSNTQVLCVAPNTDPRHAMYPFSRYAIRPNLSLARVEGRSNTIGAAWRYPQSNAT